MCFFRLAPSLSFFAAFSVFRFALVSSARFSLSPRHPLSPLGGQNALRSDKKCKAMTGLTRGEFKKLWKLAEPHFADTTTRATPRQRKRAASVDGSDGSIDGNAALFSDKVAFFVTLYWLRCYHTEDVLAVQLGVEQLNLRQHLWRGVAALASALIPVYLPGPPLYDDNKGNRGWWLDLELEQAQYIGTEPRFKWLRDNDVALALDGSEIRIGRPAKDESSRYSAKKKQHSLNVMVLVKLNGDIVLVSDPYDGVPNDQGQWKALGWRESTHAFRS